MNEEVGNRAILGTLYFVLGTFLISNFQLRLMNEEVGIRAVQCTRYKVVIRVRAEF
jgi:hypothetical protein